MMLLNMIPLDLRNIKTYILHKQTNVARKEHLTKLFTEMGLDFEFVVAYDMGDRSLQSASLTLTKLFSTLLEKDTFEPVLIVEDDVTTTQWYTNTQLEIPSDADACYLGVSSCGVVPHDDYSTVGIQYDRCDECPEWVRIYNMLSLHAFVVVTKRWLIQLVRCMVVANMKEIHFDIPVARAMPFHNVYAMHTPLFCQCAAVGGNEEYTHLTFDQIPRLQRAMQSPHTTIKHEPLFYDNMDIKQ